MKNVIILFLTAFLSFSVSSQSPYNKMLVTDTTTWQHFGITFGVKSSQPQNFLLTNNSMAALDTISIGGFLYKKLYELTVPAYINYSNKILRGFIREDSLSKKVFFKETLLATEFVLYDFSLNVGDSTFMNFPNNPSTTGFYRVDSIKTVTELCGARKHFFYRKHVNNFSPSVNYFEFIESIGSTYHLLYPYNNSLMSMFFTYQSGCYHKWELGLACKKNKQNQQYQSCTYNSPMWTNFTNSCTYYYFSGGINENSKFNQFSIYPNPATNKLTLNVGLTGNELITIKVFHLSGRLLLLHKNISFNVGDNIYELNTSLLENGIYSVVIENQHFKNSYPIVIQN